MTIAFRNVGEVAIVDLEGMVKGTDAKELISAFQSLLDRKVARIAVNFKQVSFLDSGCIGSLMTLKMQADEEGVEFLAFGLSEDMKDLFEMTCMNTVFKLYASERELLEKVES